MAEAKSGTLRIICLYEVLRQIRREATVYCQLSQTEVIVYIAKLIPDKFRGDI
jgi:hypothetical protein